jgi:DNA-binding response OmpR family regulator
MVVVMYVEEKAKIAAHQILAKELNLSSKDVSVEKEGDLIRLLNTEKPDLVIIDDKFPGIYTSPTLQALSEIKETSVILIKRTNGVKTIKKVVHNIGGIEVVTISEQELLDRIHDLKLHKPHSKKLAKKAN